jgi:hypothetical protein
MKNAKEEFIKHIQDRKVLCAHIIYGDYYYQDDDPDPRLHIKLKSGYTLEDYDNFLKLLDFNYNAGFGGQKLFGNIWYKDNTWSDRGEYDGSEWWQYQSIPEIPEELK